MFIIAIGSISDGFYFVGLFNSEAEAEEWAVQELQVERAPQNI